MDSSLLATKRQIPPQPQHGVSRSRLIDALEGDVLHYKLVLISAPAGYGKTTLLAQWAHASRCPVAWLSLGQADNNLDRFLRYLLTSWEVVEPRVSESPLSLLLEGRSPDTEAVLAAFINAANDPPDHTAFVLDDYHLIEDSAIHTALTFLLDHLPPTLHFVLAGRGEPPLPLARYRAHRTLIEFGAEDLSFRSEETQDFLNETMKLNLNQDEIDRLHTQLEGWIAGLQLVALTLQRRLTEADKLVVKGRHRFIADYLSEDVLAPLPDNLRQFLLQTSILDRLYGPLCDAVTGQEDGQATLETLERENLFLVPLDDSREWFRYHRLFADFLQEELNRHHPDEVADLHRRASLWYLAHDLPEQAFRHAVDGEDLDLVLQILDRYFAAKLLGGQVRVVEQWLNSLPEAWLSTSPGILLVQAGVMLITGQFDACARSLDKAERLAHAQKEDERLQQARITAMRCNIACFQNDLARAEALAEQALRGLPDDDLGFRPGVYGALGDTYRRNSRWQEAKDCYLKLLDFTHAPSFRVQTVHIFGALADLDLRQGHLRHAAGYWREALAAIQKRENRGAYPLPLIGWVYIRLSELLYEWNDLGEAWEHLTRGLERADLGGDVRALIAGYLIAGRLKLTEGDIDAATTYLERAQPHIESAQFSHWTNRFERLQLELWLAQDRLRAAVNWAGEMLQDDTLERRSPENEATQLAVARVLIVKGDRSSVERALALLEGLRQAAEAEGQMGVTIETLALLALAHWQRGQRTDAMTALERALRLAQPEGYVRLFADLGLPMARLLQEAHSRDVMLDYVEKLLAAFSGDISSATPDQLALPEPLTRREQEILELIAAGLTNPEIAKQLVISPGTVKKHADNIYGKLGVHSRIEAAARAKELKLLD